MAYSTEEIEASVNSNPDSAEWLYLRGADRAAQRRYDEALEDLTAALQLNPSLHMARFQLGLLLLTMGRLLDAQAVWMDLEMLPDGHALKHFKRGMECLMRDEFLPCIAELEVGIRRNDSNAALNADMSLVIERARIVLEDAAATSEPANAADKPAVGAPARRDLSLYEKDGD